MLAFFYPAADGQTVDAEGALKPAYARALQVSAQNLIAHLLRVRLLRVEAAVAPTHLALVLLLSRAGEPVALELITATIRAQMLDFFNDDGAGLLSFFIKSHIKPLPGRHHRGRKFTAAGQGLSARRSVPLQFFFR
ncbi:MAG: hypothetical protein M3R45_15420 [Pseudomonadota bacterium]|nr:hypothetical protein [Pseudomonadota bacterium]